MNNEPKPRASIEAHISAKTISGQVAVGETVTQTQTNLASAAGLTEQELKDLQSSFDDFKKRILFEAPPEKQAAAMERADELQQAIQAEKPDVTTLEYVRNWFVKNIPSLAGTVTGLIVNPIVGKLVEAAGETIAAEFKRRFGLA